MHYQILKSKITRRAGVEQSTMMKTPCLRYHGEFMAMFFEKENSLIIKVSPERVNELIKSGKGNAFNFTGKKFTEWVLIPRKYEKDYDDYITESLDYAKANI